MSIIKNLRVVVSEAKPDMFHFSCTVPGRIVTENRVTGIFVNGTDGTEWIDWVVVIERGGKTIERHMKNTPLMRQIDESLTVELKKFVESVTKDPGKEVVDIDVSKVALPEPEVVAQGGPLEMPEFLRR